MVDAIHNSQFQYGAIPPSTNKIDGRDFGMKPKGSLSFATEGTKKTDFPNSENIYPPVKKETVRVVNIHDRAEVLLSQWQEEQDISDKQIDDLRLQSFFKKQQIQQGAVLDIEV